jgi:hypothetical protein
MRRQCEANDPREENMQPAPASLITLVVRRTFRFVEDYENICSLMH